MRTNRRYIWLHSFHSYSSHTTEMRKFPRKGTQWYNFAKTELPLTSLKIYAQTISSLFLLKPSEREQKQLYI